MTMLNCAAPLTWNTNQWAFLRVLLFSFRLNEKWKWTRLTGSSNNPKSLHSTDKVRNSIDGGEKRVISLFWIFESNKKILSPPVCGFIDAALWSVTALSRPDILLFLKARKTNKIGPLEWESWKGCPSLPWSKVTHNKKKKKKCQISFLLCLFPFPVVCESHSEWQLPYSYEGFAVSVQNKRQKE